jgi:hypothetical protein
VENLEGNRGGTGDKAASAFVRVRTQERSAMEKIQTLKYHNEILLNTSLYKYLSLINETNISQIIKDVIYDNFIQTTRAFLRDQDAFERYKNEMRAPYQHYIDKTLRDGWTGIKNNLLVSSYITFELFLDHLAGIYYKNFTELYSNDDIKVSFSVIRDFKTGKEIKDYFIRSHIEHFALLGFDEKILYVKKNLKLNDDDIWTFHGKDLLNDIFIIRNKIVHSEAVREIGDDEFYVFIDYLCSLIFKLSSYSKIKYDMEFEWIQDLNRYLSLADGRN